MSWRRVRFAIGELLKSSSHNLRSSSRIALIGLRGVAKFITATVTGNFRVTEVGSEAGGDYDTHHLVLDFGRIPFPVLEGQSIGMVPPGLDASGRPQPARQYSVASPHNGERRGYNNLSLNIKRVLVNHQNRPVRGVASNFLRDLQLGDAVQVIGPFGARTQQEPSYFGPLQSFPKSFIEINFAFSHTPGAPKRYVQNIM